MIVPHPILDINVTTKEIELVADRLGYTRFIPINLVKHLMCAFSFYKVTKSASDCIQDNNAYTQSFRKLLDMIIFDEVKTNNPIEFAIKVLFLVGRRINLRKLELSIKMTAAFPIEDNEIFQNYVTDFSILTNYQLEALGIDINSIDTAELSEEVQNILRLYSGLDRLEPVVETDYQVVKETLKTYSDFSKGRRYKLALPTFPADLAMKKLHITKIDDTEILASEVVLAIDFSFSMHHCSLSKPMIKSVLLYYIRQLELSKKLTIKLAIVVGSITNVISITSVEQLQNLFLDFPGFTLPTSSVLRVFEDLNQMYPGRPVIFLTDGKANYQKAIPLKFKLHSIVLFPNMLLKQMSILSGGQYVILS